MRGKRQWAVRLAASAIFSSVLVGCAYTPTTTVQPAPVISSPKGSYYRVQPGDTLWRIAQWFGVEVNELMRQNRLTDPTQLDVGTTLFIPIPSESGRFLWPLQGRVARGAAATGATRLAVKGLSIYAPGGSLVRASRTGRVVVASQRLAGWGKAIVLDHGDGYVTVYTGFHQVFVNPGVSVRQGMPLGNVSGAPLYFEIRYAGSPHDPLGLLP